MATDVKEAAAKVAAARMIKEVKHLDGCPENPDRMESSEGVRPDKAIVTITRCQDCGAQDIVTTGRHARTSQEDRTNG